MPKELYANILSIEYINPKLIIRLYKFIYFTKLLSKTQVNNVNLHLLIFFRIN